MRKSCKEERREVIKLGVMQGRVYGRGMDNGDG